MGTTTGSSTLKLDSLTGLHWLGVLAAGVTGVLHLVLGVQFVPSGLGISFLLAGLGFFGAIALVLLDVRRRTVYTLGLPFTGVQIVLWYVLNFGNGPKSFPGDVGTLGAIDKLAQVVLIAVLIALLARN